MLFFVVLLLVFEFRSNDTLVYVGTKYLMMPRMEVLILSFVVVVFCYSE